MTYADYEERVAAFYEKVFAQGYDAVYTGDELGFKWRGCDCCGRPEGGTKHRAFAIKPRDPDGIWEFEVCGDCLTYLNYGHLDMFNGEVNLK